MSRQLRSARRGRGPSQMPTAPVAPAPSPELAPAAPLEPQQAPPAQPDPELLPPVAVSPPPPFQGEGAAGGLQQQQEEDPFPAPFFGPRGALAIHPNVQLPPELALCPLATFDGDGDISALDMVAYRAAQAHVRLTLPEPNGAAPFPTHNMRTLLLELRHQQNRLVAVDYESPQLRTPQQLRANRALLWRRYASRSEPYRKELWYQVAANQDFTQSYFTGVNTIFDWTADTARYNLEILKESDTRGFMPDDTGTCGLPFCIGKGGCASFPEVPYLSTFIRGRKQLTHIVCRCGFEAHNLCLYHYFAALVGTCAGIQEGPHFESSMANAATRAISVCGNCGLDYGDVVRRKIVAIFCTYFTVLGLVPDIKLDVRYKFEDKAHQLSRKTGFAPTVNHTGGQFHTWYRCKTIARHVTTDVLRQMVSTPILLAVTERLNDMPPSTYELMRATVGAFMEHGSWNIFSQMIRAFKGDLETQIRAATSEGGQQNLHVPFGLMVKRRRVHYGGHVPQLDE